jgi:uncharacterized protein
MYPTLAASAATAEIAPAGVPERRDEKKRMLGHLVSLNGMTGLLASHMDDAMHGDHWSVGHLISVVHGKTRLVGAVCELAADDGRWKETGQNIVNVRIELLGEVVDDADGKPRFRRGITSYPALGAVAHRIRAADLAAIFSFRGKDGIEIGRLTQNENIAATVSIGELVSRHFAVIGSTGSGKTSAVSLLVQKVLENRPALRVLIMDPHNEYRKFFPETSVVFDSENLELPYWMFQYNELVDIVFSGRIPSDDERDALFEAVKTAKMRFANAQSVNGPMSSIRRQSMTLAESGNTMQSVTADTPVPYRIFDILQIIDEWAGQLEKRYALSDLRVLRHRIETLTRDPRYKFMFNKLVVEDDMYGVLSRLFRLPAQGKPVAIVQLAGLPNEVVNAVVSVLSRIAFEMALWSEGAYEIMMVCEEAHRYIPNNPQLGFAPTRLAIGRIAKEGRKYGASLCIVSQRPAELDSTILSQCSTMFAMRLPNEADKAIVRAALSESSASVLSFLSSIADREAIAFGEAIPAPMRMRFGDCVPIATADASPPMSPEHAAYLRNNYNAKRVIQRMRGGA